MEIYDSKFKLYTLLLLVACTLWSCLDSESLENDCSLFLTAPLCFATLNTTSSAGGSSPLIIYQTAATTTGGFIGPNGADSFCAANNPGVSGTYKALIAGSNLTGGTRVASVNPDVGDGQTDWVLKASTTYQRNDGTIIGTTGSNALFSFPLQASLGTGGNYWSGLQTNWTTNVTACNATNGAWDTTSGNGATGDATITSNGAIFSVTGACNAGRTLLCVQQ